MTSHTPKPVKQCDGCKLNLKTRCAVFPHPAEQWAGGDCEGYNDPALIKRFVEHDDEMGAHLRKKIRQAKAQDLHTIDHLSTYQRRKRFHELPDLTEPGDEPCDHKEKPRFLRAKKKG